MDVQDTLMKALFYAQALIFDSYLVSGFHVNMRRGSLTSFVLRCRSRRFKHFVLVRVPVPVWVLAAVVAAAG